MKYYFTIISLKASLDDILSIATTIDTDFFAIFSHMIREKKNVLRAKKRENVPISLCTVSTPYYEENFKSHEIKIKRRYYRVATVSKFSLGMTGMTLGMTILHLLA